MVDMRQCSIKVRRSLLQRDLMFGIPTAGLLVLIVMFVLFVYMLRLLFFLVIIGLLYVIMRELTARDPWLIDISIENIQQKDVYIP